MLFVYMTLAVLGSLAVAALLEAGFLFFEDARLIGLPKAIFLKTSYGLVGILMFAAAGPGACARMLALALVAVSHVDLCRQGDLRINPVQIVTNLGTLAKRLFQRVTT